MTDVWYDGYIATYQHAHYVMGYHYWGNYWKFKGDPLNMFADFLVPHVEDAEITTDLDYTDGKFKYQAVSSIIITI